MDASIDGAASLVLVTTLVLVLGAYVASSLAAGRPLVEARVEREAALPIVGRAPMHAVYRALVPFGRLLVALGISANAISVASLAIAILAAIAFATGHFGVAALVASIASLADGVDGLVRSLWPRGALWPIAPFLAYAAWSYARADLRAEHLIVLAIVATLAYAGPRTKELLLGLYPIGLVFILFDGMRPWQRVGLDESRILVCDLRGVEARLFGSGGHTAHDFHLGAVTLCSYTTAIGYGSLLFADNQALKSFGKLAMGGEIACLLAAALFLPSLLHLIGAHTVGRLEHAK